MGKRKTGPVKVTRAAGSTELRRAGAFRKTPYWHSDRWKRKREKVLERDDCRCTACGRRRGDEDPRLNRGRTVLEVHHLTYERYGNERLTDLVTLCQRCHATEHQWLKRERKARLS